LNKLDNVLGHVRLIQEKSILKNFYNLKNSSSSKVTLGAEDTVTALENRSLSTLIINEESRIFRALKDSRVSYWTEGTPREKSLDSSKQELLIDWIMENFTKYGANLEVITANSEEGLKFLKDSGIGGIKKY